MCEDRDASMHDRGLWLRSDEDPALVPVRLFSVHDREGTVRWLTPDGGYSTHPPQPPADQPSMFDDKGDAA